MNDTDQNLNLKLVRLYVALEMTHKVAQQRVGSHESERALGTISKLVRVASEILEEVLAPPPGQQRSDPVEIQSIM